MKHVKIRWMLYGIALVILATIGIQLYWNYKNYLASKQQLINEVQISLDKAVDDYYTDLAERTTIGFFVENENAKAPSHVTKSISQVIDKIDNSTDPLSNLDYLDSIDLRGITIVKGSISDTLLKTNKHPQFSDSVILNSIGSESLDRSKPLMNKWAIETLTTKVVVSLSNDTLDLVDIEKRLTEELIRKGLAINPELNFIKDNLKAENSKISETNSENTDFLSVRSKSQLLPKNSLLTLYFNNPTKIILKRMFGGILISALLVLALMASLFYLLYIIKKQKQLAEIKNDLISNISHEFKTPIATIGVALESLSDFNAIKDPEKTKKYLKLSGNQLSKLNTMVEKLLETARLDKNHLYLQKKDLNIVDLLNDLVARYKIPFYEKNFNFKTAVSECYIKADKFHIENALNNILDNAVKYGGHNITVNFENYETRAVILISDDGKKLKQSQVNQIFEKFYRVPQGNTHDIKGYGIGLYYAKQIIEKHQGKIEVILTKKLTTFKITLPHG